MKNTFYEIITEMSLVALSGVNECFVGDIWEVEAVSRSYPLMVLDPNLKTHLYTNGMIKYRIDLYLVDLVYDDESNELDVISDMINIATQYINYLRDNSDYNFWIEKDNIGFQTFTEKWDDSVSGVKVELSIIVPDDGNNCKVMFK